MDYNLELYNTIFEARKNDDILYDLDGSVLCIYNIRAITKEFYEMNEYIDMLNYYIRDKNILYQNAFKSYELRDFLNTYEREHYILGMTYAKNYIKNNMNISTEEELDNYVNKKWKNFKNYIYTLNLEEQFIDDFSFLGMYDQTCLMYTDQKRKK